MKLWLKFLLFLVPALLGTWFVLWRFSPEQAVLRRADLVFTSVEKGTLSAGSPRDKAERLEEVLAPALEIRGPHPVPSGAFSSAQVGRMLVEFQNSILSCQISREDETVEFPTEEQAVYRALLSAETAQGPGRTYHMRYWCRIEFRRSGRAWLATLIELEAI